MVYLRELTGAGCAFNGGGGKLAEPGSVEDEGTGMSALFVQPLRDGEGVR
jgi:hypothetical protein